MPLRQPLSLSSPSSTQGGLINITVPTAGNSASSVPDNVDACIAANSYAAFPAPWACLSGDPSIEIIVTNNSLTCPVAPLLVDRFLDPVTNQRTSSIFAELTTVQPGQTIDEIVMGIPVTTMYLVAWFIGVDDSELGKSFSVNVAAYQL